MTSEREKVEFPGPLPDEVSIVARGDDGAVVWVHVPRRLLDDNDLTLHDMLPHLEEAQERLRKARA